ncbi:MAG: flnE [Candidatus Eremiobacteraeota bacterium]|nr:flnE [Candidatus Eremiobacteraeota bacterium]
MAERPTMWEEFLGGEIRYRDIDGVRTRSLEAGRGAPVVLLHGNGGHAEIYIRNIMPLAERYRVYAIDSLGHGFTDKPDLEYTVPDYVRHVVGFIDAIGGPVHLVGHGLAGWVATYLTVHHPDRVRSLVNFNGLTHVTEPDEHMETGFHQVQQLSTTATAAATSESVRKRLNWALADPASATNEMVAVRYDIYRRPDTARAMAKIVQVESRAQRRFGVSAEQLGTIRVPVQLVFSENPVENWGNFERVRDAIPGARLERADGGLIGMWEAPERWNQIVLDFLGSIEAPQLAGARG